MSNVSPRNFMLIAEHSICQPGLPSPQGDDHLGSISSFGDFQSAKSSGFFFFSDGSTLAPASIFSFGIRDSLPYSGKLSTEK